MWVQGKDSRNLEQNISGRLNIIKKKNEKTRLFIVIQYIDTMARTKNKLEDASVEKRIII